MSRYPKISINVEDVTPGIRFTQRRVTDDARGCFACSEEIGSGQVYETKEGEQLLSRVYHSRCFTCRDCRKDLRDQFYHHEGRLLCAKDFFEREGYKCALCETPVLVYIDASGTKVCESCFQCKDCKKPFPDGKGFFKHGGVFYCEQDVAKAQGQVCVECHQGVVGGAGLRALGELYHNKCFKCAGCAKELGRSFVEQDGRAFHEQCVHLEPIVSTREVRRAANPDENVWELAVVKCAACARDVPGGEGREVQGKRYHDDCLKCGQCRRVLGTTFATADGDFFCQGCAPQKSGPDNGSCRKCGKKLVGKVAKVGSHEYHADCLACFKCNAKLPSGFYLNEGRPACEDHA